MNRRAFFKTLAVSIAAVQDPERLLWRPGNVAQVE
jgi:hypothetical protein